LVDPEKRGRWLAGGAIEPRVGGVAELRFQNGTLTSEPAPDRYKKYSGLIVDRQTVTRFDPPKALGLTWGEEASPSEVLFELTPVGDQVRLVVTHSRLSLEGRIMVSGGWHAHLALLASQLEGIDPPPFWSLLGEVDAVYRRDAGSEARP
jgi:uncharacterized protein YndB with AHSA1/START domain